MPTLFTSGIPYDKKDGQCAHPSCQAAIDWKQHDKPPAGWGHVTMARYTKKGGHSHATFVVCPQHTIGFGERTPSLLGRTGKLIRSVIESPFAGDIAANLRYLRAAMRDALVNHQEAPYASHALYTQDGVLNDSDPAERALGIAAGFTWAEAAQKVAVYGDLGISPGMAQAIERHKANGLVVEYRKVSGWFDGQKTTGDRLQATGLREATGDRLQATGLRERDEET